jgi:hypothetical protein
MHATLMPMEEATWETRVCIAVGLQYTVSTRGGQLDELQELHFRKQLRQEPCFIEMKRRYNICYPIPSLNRAFVFQEFEAFRISEHSAHEGVKGCQP